MRKPEQQGKPNNNNALEDWDDDAPDKTLKSRYPLWVRFSLVVLALLLGAALFWVKYRTAEMARPFSTYQFSGQFFVLNYLLGRDEQAAALLAHDRPAFFANDVRSHGQAVAALLKGDFSQAEKIATQEVEKSPRNFNARITLAQSALMQGDYQRALTLAKANLAAAPYPYNAAIISGVAAARLNLWDEATTYFGVANMQMYRGNRDAVVEHLLSLIADSKKSGLLESDPALGINIYRLLSHWDPLAMNAAESLGRRAITLDKRADVGWLGLCAARFKRQELDGARQACEAGEKVNPDNIDLIWQRAYVLSAQGDTANEVAAVLRATALAPDNFYISNDGLRVFSEKLGDFPKVIAFGEGEFARGRRHSHVLEWVGYAEAKMGNAILELQYLSEANQLEPNNVNLMYSLANSLNDNQRFDEALALLKVITVGSPRWQAPWMLRASIAMNRKDYVAAVSAYETAFTLKAANAEQLSSLCVAFLQGGQYEKAGNCIDRVLQMDPSNVLAKRLSYEVNMNHELVRRQKGEK